MPAIAIVTRHDDFHAYVIRHALTARGADCSIILSDSMAMVGGMSWSPNGGAEPATVRDVDGRTVVVAALDVVWWRRLTGDPRIPVELEDDDARELVVNECRASLLGLLLSDFTGTWVSHPERTRTAHNKLLQLVTARHAGLRLPRTLVSQDPEKVRRFCDELDYQVVAKTVGGSQRTPTATGKVTPGLLTDTSIQLCPTIYQELVPGTRHLRVCCFGRTVHAAVLETEGLDWRYPFDATVQPYQLDDDTASRLLQVIEDLCLRMGIIDMKLAPDGSPVWLEVNPQGQFLFLEGLCNELSLIRAFADFLLAEAASSATRREART